MATNQGSADTTGQTATTGQGGEFGTSEFGERLDYGKPKYQDLWAFILFYVHVTIIVVLCIYFWGVTIPGLREDADTNSSSSNNSSENDTDTTGIWLTLIASLFAGALFGMLWLQCMKMFAEMIIKILLFVQIGAWALVAIMGFAIGDGGLGLIIIGIVFMLLTMLYTWWYVYNYILAHTTQKCIQYNIIYNIKCMVTYTLCRCMSFNCITNCTNLSWNRMVIIRCCNY